jgi:uncharacterized membrane protein HdeD (DUF308 family)
MKIFEKLHRFDGFESDWRRLLIQWIIIMLAGLFMALASVVNPDALILSARQFSWLPASGIFLFVLGLLECLDAFLTKRQRDVIQNLQVGVTDLVIGGMLVLSITGPVQRVGIMIAAFLMVRGIVRFVMAYALQLPHKVATAIGGLVSIVLGVCVFQGWPTDKGWFMSLCLNIEIAFRGWAGVSFALWVKNNNNQIPD